MALNRGTERIVLVTTVEQDIGALGVERGRVGAGNARVVKVVPFPAGGLGVGGIMTRMRSSTRMIDDTKQAVARIEVLLRYTQRVSFLACQRCRANVATHIGHVRTQLEHLGIFDDIANLFARRSKALEMYCQYHGGHIDSKVFLGDDKLFAPGNSTGQTTARI